MSDSPPARSDVPKRRPLTGRRLLWGLAGAFLLLVLVAAFGAWRTFRAAEETIARHRARLPAEYAALAALPRGRPPLLEPAQEGEATAVVQAFLAAVEAVPRADRDRVRGSNRDPVLPVEIAAILAAHPEPLAAIAPLLHVPSSPPALAADVARWDLQFGYYSRYMAGREWLDAAAKRARQSGDGAAARGISALYVALGGECARSLSGYFQEVGDEAERRGARTLVLGMAVSPIGAEEARRLRRGLEAGDAARLPLRVRVQTERYRFRGWFAGHEELSEGDPGWKYLWSWDVCRAEALEGWDAALDAMTSVLRSPSPDAHATEARAAAVAAARRGNQFLDFNLDLFVRGVGSVARAQAQLQVARTSLAVAEYAARRGRLPAVLADLVPDFLSAVPLDPWDGAPLRYAGGKVWSVGMDGKDDGGTPPTDPNDDAGRDGDVVAPAPLVR